MIPRSDLSAARDRVMRRGFSFVGEGDIMGTRVPMTGIQFVTDEKGRKVAIQIDLKKYGVVLEDFWDGLISESRIKEKGIPLEKIKADLIKRGRLRE